MSSNQPVKEHCELIYNTFLKCSKNIGKQYIYRMPFMDDEKSFNFMRCPQWEIMIYNSHVWNIKFRPVELVIPVTSAYLKMKITKDKTLEIYLD